MTVQQQRSVEVDASDFRPTATQARFLASTDRIVGFFGGYGSGKTRSGAEKALDLAALNEGCAGIIVSPTWNMLERTTLPAFEKACPKQLIRRRSKSERRIDLINGATVYYGSADNPDSLEGTNLAWFWLDEARLAERSAWNVLVGRIRDKAARRMQGFVTSTPAMGWLSEVFQRAPAVALHGSTRENEHNLGDGYIEHLRATYSPRLAKSLIDGEFSVLEGAVFEEFDDKTHVVAFDLAAAIRAGTVRLVVGADFGVQRPALVVAAEVVTPTQGRAVGDLVLVDELLPDQHSTERWIPLLDALLARIATATYGYAAPLVPHRIFVDPAGNQRDQATGMPSVHLLQVRWGHDVVRWETDPGRRLVSNGIAWLQGRLRPVDGSRPRLYVAQSLATRPKRDNGERGLMRMFREYRYPVGRNGLVGDQPLKDGLLDHVADALRYLELGVRRESGWIERPPVPTLSTRTSGPVLVSR